MVTRVCPLLQPDPLSAFLHPFWARANKCLIEAKSRTVVEIQHLLPPPASPPHPPPSKDRKEAIMFKHPHYEPQVSRCGSLSIKGFNRWRKREWGERERGGDGERERVSEREGKREDWRLFFFSIDSSTDSHRLLLNEGP